MKERSFRVYLTDALQAAAENTAVSAAALTEGRYGRAMTRRWAELNRPAPPRDARTAEEIIAHIKNRLGAPAD